MPATMSGRDRRVAAADVWPLLPSGRSVARTALPLVLSLLAGATAPAAAEDGGEGDNRIVHKERGEASFYGPGLEGKPTASGEKLDGDKLTAAHPKLPLGTEVTVTNTETGEKVEVEVNDRGPHAKGRVIDLSTAAAREIGITKKDGTAPVTVEATAAQVEEGKSDEVGQGKDGGKASGEGKDEPKRKKAAAAD